MSLCLCMGSSYLYICNISYNYVINLLNNNNNEYQYIPESQKYNIFPTITKMST